MVEIWKPIPGYEALYDVSNQGRVRSYRGPKGTGWYIANMPQRILTPGRQTAGYATVVLRNSNHKACSKLLHRLVLLTFVGPCPDSLESCHNDGDRSNNHLSNLRYDSPSANQRDIPRRVREERVRARIPDSTVIAIRQDRAAGISVSFIAEKHAVTKPMIYNVCTGKTYKDIAGPLTKGRVHRFNMIAYKEPVMTEQTSLEKNITENITELVALVNGPSWPGRQHRIGIIIGELSTSWNEHRCEQLDAKFAEVFADDLADIAAHDDELDQQNSLRRGEA